jgi:hypothetical protein
LVGTSNFGIGNSDTNLNMTILNNGNVGINTPTPTNTLDIDGTLHVNSNTTMKDTLEIAPTINEQ